MPFSTPRSAVVSNLPRLPFSSIPPSASAPVHLYLYGSPFYLSVPCPCYLALLTGFRVLLSVLPTSSCSVKLLLSLVGLLALRGWPTCPFYSGFRTSAHRSCPYLRERAGSCVLFLSIGFEVHFFFVAPSIRCFYRSGSFGPCSLATLSLDNQAVLAVSIYLCTHCNHNYTDSLARSSGQSNIASDVELTSRWCSSF